MKDSVDYVVHLGDYIYEYKNGYYGWGDALGRVPLPNKEIYSLYDYRKRLATYRTDLDLLASHQQVREFQEPNACETYIDFVHVHLVPLDSSLG
jgi:phosphodiesterase/alkaline phosphatase D-like protein